MQENVSNLIVSTLDAWRDANETLAERMFFAVYGSPSLQAAAGIDAAASRPLRRASRHLLHDELLQKRIAELKWRIAAGGPRESVIRGLLYAGMNRAAIDERGFEIARRIREEHGEMSLAEFKALLREQFNLLQIDQDAALAAIPAMLPPDRDTRLAAFELIRQILGARGKLSADDERRVGEVARLFGVDEKGRSTLRHARAS
jgi:hypothetical protein